jgi:hypothetical protein
MTSALEMLQRIGAHSGGNQAAKIRAGLLRQHKTPRPHIEHLSDQLLRSLHSLQSIPGDSL